MRYVFSLIRCPNFSDWDGPKISDKTDCVIQAYINKESSSNRQGCNRRCWCDNVQLETGLVKYSSLTQTDRQATGKIGTSTTKKGKNQHDF